MKKVEFLSREIRKVRDELFPKKKKVFLKSFPESLQFLGSVFK